MATNKAAQFENVDYEQFLQLMRLLEGYSQGKVNLTSLGDNSISAPQGAAAAPTNETGPVNGMTSQAGPTNNAASASSVNTGINVGQAANTLGMVANVTQNNDLGQISQALGMVNAISNPNATPASIAQAFAPVASQALGIPGIGSIASIANNGLTANNSISLAAALGLVSPVAATIMGIANTALGNPAGAIGNTIGNPNSMGIANSIGISNMSQIANAFDQNQTMDDQAMAQMDALMNALAQDDSDANSSGGGSGGGPGGDSGSGVGNGGPGPGGGSAGSGASGSDSGSSTD